MSPNHGFNPKARWDRQPLGVNPDPETIDENIEVIARFKNAKIYPQMFIWKNKDFTITNITYNWQERRGQAVINYFSVNTDSGLYQISFNNTSFGWRIDKIIN